MNNNRTFRLFISSTFDDFRKEREVLQVNIFPRIKEYCSKQGYAFQPIDLRWGVSNEAQLDQKTLDLCLNEVRSCKVHSYPNFLVMIGDRYGWVPLPYLIESHEFVSLCDHMTDDEKIKLKKWYVEDCNQVPAAYLLKERQSEFTEFEKWNEVERELRIILQHSAKAAGLKKAQLKKYTISATEAEVEEGMIEYSNPTAFQQTLLKNAPKMIKRDRKSIFGFIRNIDLQSQNSDRYIAKDYPQAQAFKDKVISLLPNKNILQCQTSQLDESNLDYWYLDQFAENTFSFLKSKIDKQISRDKKANISSLHQEINAHKIYAHQKSKIFIGRRSLLSRMRDYISSEETSALIVHGSSGSGKSALLSKAIENTKAKSHKQVVYRFVGATAQSSSTIDILSSIFLELGIDVNATPESTEDNNKIEIRDNEKKSESFDDFSVRMLDQFKKIKGEVVIFIDAVDQLSHPDSFLWIPRILPANVKIIISALDDDKYRSDSTYLSKLNSCSENTLLIGSFEHPSSLLRALLEVDNRKIQSHQETYFLEQFEKYKSPFFVYVAAQEIKHWKSYDSVPGHIVKQNNTIKKLTDDQNDIVSSFISNLSSNYHHETEFVQKVLSFILASEQGLSENELLELMSTDRSFISTIAPETWHDNPNKELPTVIWTRLYAHLKPFLSLKLQDGEQLLYFFHREFKDVLLKKSSQKTEHEKLVKATFTLLGKYQNDDFNSNRWGRLYQIIEHSYNAIYNAGANDKQYILNMAELKNTGWKRSFVKYILEMSVTQNNHFKVNRALYNAKNAHIITKHLVLQKDEQWNNLYAVSMIDMAHYNSKVNNFQLAFEINSICLEFLRSKYKPSSELESTFITCLGNHALFLKELDKLDEAIEIYGELMQILEPKLRINPTIEVFNSVMYAFLNMSGLFVKRRTELDIQAAEGLVLLVIEKTKNYLEDNMQNQQFFFKASTILGMIKNIQGKLDEAKIIEEGLTDLLEIKRKTSNVEANEDEIISKINLMRSYSDSKDFLKAQKIGVGLEPILEKLIKDNKSRWIEWHFKLLGSLGTVYNGLRDTQRSFAYTEKCLIIVEELYNEDPTRWQEEYLRSTINHSYEFKERNQLEESLAYLKKALRIVEPLFQKAQFQWGEIYLTILGNTGSILSSLENKLQAIKYEQKAFDTAKDLYSQDPKRWTMIYTNTIINLTSTLHDLDFGPKPIKLLLLKAYDIIRPLYDKKPEYWGERFVHCLKNLINFYSTYNQPNKEQEMRVETLNVTAQLYNLNPVRFGQDHATELFEITTLSFSRGDVKDALNYGKEALSICEQGFENSPRVWSNRYLDMLYILAKINHHNRNLAESIHNLEQGVPVLKSLYNEDRSWKETLVKFLGSLVNICHENGDSIKAIEYERMVKFLQ